MCSITKSCTRCKEEKCLCEYFSDKRARDSKTSDCKRCKQATQKIWNSKNREYLKDYSREYHKKKRKWIEDLKSNSGCLYCGESFSPCLHFHHVDPTKKRFTIGTAVESKYSRQDILEEIDKCIILCANCHIKEHERWKQISSQNKDSDAKEANNG